MHKILEKRRLSNDVERGQDVFYFKVTAPEIARNRKAGQFIIFQIDDNYGERVPLTIADANAEEGWIAIVFQTVGASTFKLANDFEVGDEIPVIVGPLGRPTHIEKFTEADGKPGTVICVGGGIGVAPLFPIVQANHAIGNHVITIIGARSKNLLILEEEMRANSDELIIVTDDGTYGRKGLVTEPLKELCEKLNPAAREIVSIGPGIMMKFCVETARPFNIPITTSLNTIMIDGTGMCGCCRVTVGGETKFVCVDGPEFDGYKVDFDNMMKRMASFKPREQADYQKAKERDHKCRIGLN
ncbi:MAG: sulfide/dihydroorotate dehydrogenase-like FAD/NAD-binding protein [Synergistaceae bacterium]|nr:sulfide/dihydroorotate dehydrogenase-like FAD/NAD-binding protein [Synergistaceae bacterium]